MPRGEGARPPWSCRCLIGMASRLVPAPDRPAWHRRRASGLAALCVLVDRGVLPGQGHLAAYCRECAADALRQRFAAERFSGWVRSPGFIAACAAALVAAAAMVSGGFPATRRLVRIACDVDADPLSGGVDTLVVHSIPLVFALMVGVALAAIERARLRTHGWRCWSFFAMKTAAALAIMPALWCEAVAALRAALPDRGPWGVLPVLLLTLGFVIALARTLSWSFEDQRHRCPVCLRRLARPVTVGSWSSVLEPAAIEMVCSSGHGCLCLPETESGQDARWTALDPSWREIR